MSTDPQQDDRLFAVDAFCGAGGLTLGLRDAGFDVRAAFDTESSAVESYRRNIGDHARVEDIRSVSGKVLHERYFAPDRVSLVAGGPPCQGFSIQRRHGDSDPRNSLPAEFLRLIVELAPRYFLLENVPGMRGRHGEAILLAFVEDAKEAGYVCHQAVLDAVNYGVPQYRRRLFVVGERSEDGRTWFKFPSPATSDSDETTWTGAALRDLPSPCVDFSEHSRFPNHKRTRLSPLNQKRIELIPPGGGMEDLPTDLRAPCHRNGAARIGHRFVYGRLHPNRPSATITARFDSFTRGKFGHPEEPRNITLREGARLQSFPDSFRFYGTQEQIAAQIGNAVPPRLGSAIGRAIRDAIRAADAGAPPVCGPEATLFASR